MTTEQLLKKATVIGDLIRDVDEYLAEERRPIPLRVLSSLYSRRLQHLGGFGAVVSELKNDGSLHIIRQGEARKVYPGRFAEAFGSGNILKFGRL